MGNNGGYNPGQLARSIVYERVRDPCLFGLRSCRPMKRGVHSRIIVGPDG